MRQVSNHVRLLGNGFFNFYLVGNKTAALVECGTTAAAQIFREEWADLAEKPAVKYIIALHSHFDHICGIPLLLDMFPDAKVVASSAAQKTMAREEIMADHFRNDALVSQTYLDNGFIDQIPDVGQLACALKVDMVVGEGDTLNIEPGLSIKILDAPGHSVCSIAAYIPEDQVMLVSDAVGFVATSGIMPPIFFQGYDLYVDTIQKLKQYPTQVLGGAHGGLAVGDKVAQLYEQSLASAEDVCTWIMEQLQAGMSEDDLTSMLYDTYMKDGLSYYPKEMMMAVMNLIIKRSKARNK